MSAKTVLDLEKIKADLESAEPYKDDGQWLKSAYIGSALDSPSGKYYTPWANSNVDGCDRCNNTGSVQNPHADAKKHAAAERNRQHLTKIALRWFGAWCSGGWPAGLSSRIAKVDARLKYYKPTMECPQCGGSGSVEASKDECWYASIESELESIGASLESGEGDATDLFAIIGCENPNDDDKEESAE